MARLSLTLPEKFIYQTSLRVRISDINYGGHLGNDAVLSIIHESRFRFLNHLGYANETSMENNTGIALADSAVIYKSEAFHGDPLQIHIAAYDFNKYGMDLFYLILHEENGKEITRAKTNMVFVNYIEKRVARVPEEFIKRLRELEAYTI